jgi:hypothetical protein
MNFIYFCKYINEKRALHCRFTASIFYFIFLAILTKYLIIWTNITEYMLFETTWFSFSPTKNETIQFIFFYMHFISQSSIGLVKTAKRWWVISQGNIEEQKIISWVDATASVRQECHANWRLVFYVFFPFKCNNV